MHKQYPLNHGTFIQWDIYYKGEVERIKQLFYLQIWKGIRGIYQEKKHIYKRIPFEESLNSYPAWTYTHTYEYTPICLLIDYMNIFILRIVYHDFL